MSPPEPGTGGAENIEATRSYPCELSMTDGQPSIRECFHFHDSSSPLGCRECPWRSPMLKAVPDLPSFQDETFSFVTSSLAAPLQLSKIQ